MEMEPPKGIQKHLGPGGVLQPPGAGNEEMLMKRRGHQPLPSPCLSFLSCSRQPS